MSEPLIELSSLLPDERKSIEDHARRIPRDWSVAKMPRIRIPTLHHWTNRPAPDDYSKPRQIEYVEFEIKRIERNGDGRRWSALVANGHIIVEAWPR